MSRPTGLVDVHCHLLPAFDDGPPSAEESLQLCEQLVEQGVSAAAATSHQRGTFVSLTLERILEAAAELSSRLKQRNIPLSIVPSAEWMLDAATVEDLESLLPDLLTIAAGGRYALVEFPYHFPPYAPMVGEFLAEKKLKPILAHVEQYAVLCAAPARLQGLLASGYLFQVNADSIVGAHGTRRQRMCQRLIQAGWVHFVASDAHSVTMRPCRLADAWEQVRRWTSEDSAAVLFRENPRAAIEGADIARIEPTTWLKQTLRKLGWERDQ